MEEVVSEILLERMSGYDAAKTEKIGVWWDMNDCPIPEGYDARRVRPSIERAFKERGYSGPVSITAYADQTQTPSHVLRGLSSSGVAVAHTRSGSTCSVMHRDMVEWRGQNPPPGTIMIISDQVNGDFSWDLARLQQRTRYGLFLAYSKKQCNDYLLVYFANCRWEKLLEEGGAPPVVVAGELSSAAMFYCKSCNFDCQSLKKFRNHLSSYKHGMEDAITPPVTKFLFATKSWARNYPASPEHATSKIHVLWDMNDCPIPEGYDARQVRPSIEMAFEEIGYSGPVSITAYADQTQTPVHHLLALSSTGVDFAHTLPWVHYSRMITDFEIWTRVNPAPASVMIISDEVASSKSRSKIICLKLQKFNYNCFLAYSVRPSETPLLVTSAEWLWESLLAVSETRRHILHKCSESERVVASTGMFCCKLCFCDCKSLDAFNKHLSNKEHRKEEHRMLAHTQSFRRSLRQFKISKYHDQVGCPPKRMRKAPRKGFLPRPLRFTRR
ncbi:uncharacterized protein LOC103861482 isoform X1 [Brassica rapa]|nr:uncharacterized protein LOC103861482 isoform X1 [Brassica rapa]